MVKKIVKRVSLRKSKISEKIALSVFAVSILMVFILSLMYFNNSGGIVGRVVENEEEINGAVKIKMSCFDSDGKNYFEKGVVDYCDESGCYSEEDSCIGDKVIEEYCEGNVKNSEKYLCKDECDDGVCLNVITEFKYLLSGGGGGGGGGSSSSSSPAPAPVVSGESYDIGNFSEIVSEVDEGDTIQFVAGGSAYTLTLQSNTQTQATINLIQTFSLGVGAEQEIDLNSDAINDIYVKLVSINTISGKVKLMLRKIS